MSKRFWREEEKTALWVSWLTERHEWEREKFFGQEVVQHPRWGKGMFSKCVKGLCKSILWLKHGSFKHVDCWIVPRRLDSYRRQCWLNSLTLFVNWEATKSKSVLINGRFTGYLATVLEQDWDYKNRMGPYPGSSEALQDRLSNCDERKWAAGL